MTRENTRSDDSVTAISPNHSRMQSGRVVFKGRPCAAAPFPQLLQFSWFVCIPEAPWNGEAEEDRSSEYSPRRTAGVVALHLLGICEYLQLYSTSGLYPCPALNIAFDLSSSYRIMIVISISHGKARRWNVKRPQVDTNVPVSNFVTFIRPTLGKPIPRDFANYRYAGKSQHTL